MLAKFLHTMQRNKVGTKKSRLEGKISVVMLGSDLGVYSFARSLHATYGLRTKVVARAAFGPIANSRIIDFHPLGLDVTRDTYIDYLLDHRDALCGDAKVTIVLTNTDHLVEAMSARESELRPHYFLPLTDLEGYRAVSDKLTFAKLCEAADVPTAKTVGVEFADLEAALEFDPREHGLEFPVIAKPSLSADIEQIEYEGKRKVHLLHSQAENEALLQSLAAAGFRGEFVFQERILGGDTAMNTLTGYVNSQGELTLMASTRMLLVDHTPNLTGATLASLSEEYPELMEMGKRILKESGYKGFFNLDIKRDSDTQKPYFLELNPRPGRSCFMLEVAGWSIAQAVVEDALQIWDEPTKQIGVRRKALYMEVPRFLLMRYLNEKDRKIVKNLARRGNIFHPAYYSKDASCKRRWYVFAATAKQIWKFLRYYPKIDINAL